MHLRFYDEGTNGTHRSASWLSDERMDRARGGLPAQAQAEGGPPLTVSGRRADGQRTTIGLSECVRRTRNGRGNGGGDWRPREHAAFRRLGRRAGTSPVPISRGMQSDQRILKGSERRIVERAAPTGAEWTLSVGETRNYLETAPGGEATDGSITELFCAAGSCTRSASARALYSTTRLSSSLRLMRVKGSARARLDHTVW